MNEPIKTGINATGPAWRRVFHDEVKAGFHRHLDFDESLIAESPDPAIVARSLEGARIVLSTWDAVPYTPELLARCPDLELILHAAGTVKFFVTEELEKRGVAIVSAARMNAIPVAEFTLGLILTSLKNVFEFKMDFMRRGRAAWDKGPVELNGGYYRTRIGLIGDGNIVRLLLDLLKSFSFEVLVDSEYFSPADELHYGARRADFREVMSSCDVVSLHHADIPRWWDLINCESLALMKKGARLINTSRGRIINEADLVEKLKTGDITAFLDVTHPEPPAEDHPFYSLPNCILTPHVAGSVGTEVRRMSEFCLAQLENRLAGRPMQGLVDYDELAARA